MKFSLPLTRIIKAESVLQLGDVGIVHRRLHLELRLVREIAAIERGGAVDGQLRAAFLNDGVVQRYF